MHVHQRRWEIALIFLVLLLVLPSSIGNVRAQPNQCASSSLPCTVTFNENGLSGGTWSVTFNGSAGSNNAGSSIQFEAVNGSYGYTVTAVPGYTASPSSGSVTVNGADVTVPTITFTAIPTYTVTFTESGLPGGTQWTVNLDGTPQASTSTTNVFSGETDGTYSYSVSSSDARYAPSPASGSVKVSGADVNKDITFTEQVYTLTFTESGLPGSTQWSVSLNGGSPSSSSGTTISFSEPNGSYSFSVSTSDTQYSPSPGSGSIGISGGPANQGITFSLQSYTVTFTEVGLPGGTMWSVTFDGQLGSSTASQIDFSEPNGTYSFTVASVGAYGPSPASGKVTVEGGPTGKTITFTFFTYTVTFTETGLPTGTEWSVTLGGDNIPSVSNSLMFTETNGSYPFTVYSSNSQYRPLHPTGTVKVAGKNVGNSVTFSLVTYELTFTETGLATGTNWSVTIASQSEKIANTPNIQFAEANGTWSYTLGNVYGYTTTSYSGQATVAGSAQGVQISWTELLYTLTFLESGLPTGSKWFVNLTINATASANSSSTSVSIAFSVPDGNYTFHIYGPSGYYPIPSTSSVEVNGEGTQTQIDFSQSEYSVTFVESGLARGTTWKVTINGFPESGNTTTLVTEVASGTSTYVVSSVNGYSITANASGSVEVATQPVIVNVTFLAYTYPIEFEETGLSQSSIWSVTLNGVYRTSTGATAIDFTLADGTYNFTIGGVISYDITSWTIGSNTFFTTSGNVTVSGRLVSVLITFGPVATYTVTFYETGLILGTAWSVSIGQSTVFSTTNFTEVELPDGTWSYYLGGVTGYAQANSSGLVTIDGAPQTIRVTYAPTSTNGYLGPPKGFSEAELIIIASAVIAVIIIAVALYIRGRHETPESGAEGSPTGTTPGTPDDPT
ncbi:MAG: hypothetical protein WA549_00860 [Thermoplasmata archaeon]